MFKTSFLISGIMCFEGCGGTIQKKLQACFDECKKEKPLTDQAELIIDAEAQSLGIHRIFVSIEDTDLRLEQDKNWEDQIHERFKKALESIVNDDGAPQFKLVNFEDDSSQKTSKNTHWIHIALNLFSATSIFILSILVPPSLFLTIGLAAASFLTTAYTAREYLINFFKNIRHNKLINMSSTITLGWVLSLMHTLYHAITMPLMNSFSMMFMSFIMPILLITVINVMDEIKEKILNKSKKMYLKGTRLLFPQMDNTYPYYSLTDEEQGLISESQLDKNPTLFFQLIKRISTKNSLLQVEKNALKKGMIIQVKKGACFPVDCLLMQENALVDSSLLNGEPQQIKRRGDSIPAGAINLSDSITVLATSNSYNSLINRILFRSNRTNEAKPSKPNNQFTYLYSALIFIGMSAAIIAPFALGIITIPLILQNITGILFAICPCTLAIAHQLPRLLNRHQRAQRGILIREESLCEQTSEIHTVLFDKTGTLTTGNSEVETTKNISAELWQRVYLLEKDSGAEHPIAKAIVRYYEKNARQPNNPIKDIKDVTSDPNNFGLSGTVQGRTIHIGNAQYLINKGIRIPENISNTTDIDEGCTRVYVAEDKTYKGVIYIKHEIRKDILDDLFRLKREGKKIVMLTGDSLEAAKGFNKKNGSPFDEANIYAEQSPTDKQNLIANRFMSSKETNPQGVWFVGDGLNDAPCAKMVTQQGGISCSISPDDKTSFFSNISLNGSLNYLFKHNKLNAFFNKNVLQNQALLIYGTLAFIAFILCFSIAGIAVSPIIPLMMMASTTLMILFNSYRIKLQIDNTLLPQSPWLKQFLASDASIALLAGSSALFVSSLLISTIMTGGLALPAVIFTAGATAAVSSVFLLTAGALLAAFITLTTAYLLMDKIISHQKKEPSDLQKEPCSRNNEPRKKIIPTENQSLMHSFWKSFSPVDTKKPPVEDNPVSFAP